MAEPGFRVRAFQTGDAPAFAALNRRWIERYFGMEDQDHRMLEEPEAVILKPGGYIAMAEANGTVIATGALMAAKRTTRGTRLMELVKMATDPSAQGQGVGSAVIDHLIDVVHTRDADEIWLETNDTLTAATALYRRKGFRALSPGEEHPTPYSRCNLQMVLKLRAINPAS
ncbi:MAG: GNAT family N-acetyltransferase [Pseudomonadota bacterium]